MATDNVKSSSALSQSSYIPYQKVYSFGPTSPTSKTSSSQVSPSYQPSFSTRPKSRHALTSASTYSLNLNKPSATINSKPTVSFREPVERHSSTNGGMSTSFYSGNTKSYGNFNSIGSSTSSLSTKPSDWRAALKSKNSMSNSYCQPSANSLNSTPSSFASNNQHSPIGQRRLPSHSPSPKILSNSPTPSPMTRRYLTPLRTSLLADNSSASSSVAPSPSPAHSYSTSNVFGAGNGNGLLMIHSQSPNITKSTSNIGQLQIPKQAMTQSRLSNYEYDRVSEVDSYETAASSARSSPCEEYDNFSEKGTYFVSRATSPYESTKLQPWRERVYSQKKSISRARAFQRQPKKFMKPKQVVDFCGQTDDINERINATKPMAPPKPQVRPPSEQLSVAISTPQVSPFSAKDMSSINSEASENGCSKTPLDRVFNTFIRMLSHAPSHPGKCEQLFPSGIINLTVFAYLMNLFK